MNIEQITGSNEDSPLWAYFVLAVSLMAATFGGWYIWSRVPAVTPEALGDNLDDTNTSFSLNAKH